VEEVAGQEHGAYREACHPAGQSTIDAPPSCTTSCSTLPRSSLRALGIMGRWASTITITHSLRAQPTRAGARAPTAARLATQPPSVLQARVQVLGRPLRTTLSALRRPLRTVLSEVCAGASCSSLTGGLGGAAGILLLPSASPCWLRQPLQLCLAVPCRC